MLTVTRLKLSNICQYDTIDIPIETGLMAVCGRNGSGKSTLLRGLMYGLTGLVDGSWGTQQNLQRDGCAIPGYVLVTLKDDQTNKEYIIKRYSVSGTKFPDSVTEFQNGEYTEVATRRKTVDAFLGELYGISCALLFQLCWGRQGQLDMLLTAPAAYVSSFLSGVWNTKYLETLRDRLKSAIDQVAVMADPQQELKDAEKEKADLEAKKLEYEGLVTNLSTQLSALDEEKEALEKQLNTQSVEDAKKHAALTERWNVLNERMSEFAAGLVGADLDAVKDKTVEELQEAYNNAQTELTSVSTRIDELTARSNTLLDELRQLHYEIDEARENLNDAKKMKERVDAALNGDKTICAFCGGHVENEQIYMSHIMSTLGYPEASSYDVLDEHIAELEKDFKALNGLYNQKSDDRNKLMYSMKDLRDKEESLKVVLNFSRVHLNTGKLLAKYAELDSQRSAIAQERDKYANNAKDATLTAKISEVTGKRDACSETLKQMSKELAHATARIESLTQYMERLQVEKDQFDVNSSARSVLTLLRDVFSQQRAQARYFASKTGELNEHLAAFLELTGMPFNLRLDPDTRLFSYTSEGGFEHPTAHLSGAQKNISAVALQMALVEVIRPNINLFLFDEPSESLDVENKIIMAELFRRMNRILPSIGGTMLIVSRDEQLIEACENTININQKEN